MSKLVIGIDPGKTEAIALLKDGSYLDVRDYVDGPTNAGLLCRWLILHAPDLAVIEKVHSSPQMGVVSAFSFGANTGHWEGILDTLQIPWQSVRPQTWQKGIVPKKKSATDKPGLLVARRLWPDAPLTLKKHDGRADALLIARWGYLQMIGGEKNE